jgi:hypothetical protein
MTRRRYIGPFIKAVLAGTAVGVLPILLVFMPLFLAIGGSRQYGAGNGVFGAIYFSTIASLATIFIVGVSSLVIGAPLDLVTRRAGFTSSTPYVVSGLFFGAVIPVVLVTLLGAPEHVWLGVLGAFSGAVTGRVWWRATRAKPTP